MVRSFPRRRPAMGGGRSESSGQRKSVQGLTPEQVAVVFKNVPVMPSSARQVSFFLGNQELTLAAVTLMAFAIVLALIQTAQVRRLKHQIAAMRAQSAHREKLTPARS